VESLSEIIVLGRALAGEKISMEMQNRQSLTPLAEAAVGMIQDGSVVGLGSGHTVAPVIELLGRRVRDGLRIRGIPTSQATADLATRLGIPLVSWDDVETIDVTLDGADEIAPNFDLIKGLGGALVREKIVAAASRRLVIVVGSEKLVSALGERGVLPVEVVPFGLACCRRRLTDLGYPAAPRQSGGQLFVTDNGNFVLDCQTPVLRDPPKLEQLVRSIPGVVCTGLFLGMAHTILVDHEGQIELRQRESS